jgi:hypothetical protein
MAFFAVGNGMTSGKGEEGMVDLRAVPLPVKTVHRMAIHALFRKSRLYMVGLGGSQVVGPVAFNTGYSKGFKTKP